MTNPFPLYYLPDQHLHDPQTQVSFGQLDRNPEQPYRAAATLAAIQSLPNIRPIPRTRLATDEEVQAAALQFVRKISGYRQPSRRNAAAFDAAVADITAASQRLLHLLTQTETPASS